MTDSMECECSIDSCDLDPCDVWIEKYQKARKEHRCCECYRIIKPGERYQVIKLLHEGDWDYVKTCITCAAIRRDYGQCSYLGNLREAIEECLGFDYVTGELARWAEENE